jgi:predicted component of type VI protein secretion system
VNGAVFVEQRPMEGREIEATPGAVIGREGTDVVLNDPEVSRRHAAIREHDGGVAIEDLGSTNGTFVNDRRIGGLEPLRDGDTVRFGNTVWSLRAPAAPAAPPPADATQIGGQMPAAPAAAGPPPAAPQVTAARSIPNDIQAPSPGAAPAAPQPPAQAPAAPAPQAPAPQAPAQPAAPSPQAPAQPAAPSPQAVGPRGDVPAPPEVAPSAIRRVLPTPAAGQAPAFTPPGQRRISSKSGSAATRVEATVVCLLFALAVAVALVVYFATR